MRHKSDSFSLRRKPWAGAVSVVEYLLACLPEVLGSMSSTIKKEGKGGVDSPKGRRVTFPQCCGPWAVGWPPVSVSTGAGTQGLRQPLTVQTRLALNSLRSACL